MTDAYRKIDRAWDVIFDYYSVKNHDFDKAPYILKAVDIKNALKESDYKDNIEPRILCKQDTRESRPQIFQESGLFILPVKNGIYAIVRGEGYVDIPPVEQTADIYQAQLDFTLDTINDINNSKIQQLDYAYATSLVRNFMADPTLVLAIRGRKYTPRFSFHVNRHHLEVESVQTEVDAGYEGRNELVLVEAKNSQSENTIIRQLFYPYRLWSHYIQKPVVSVFFERKGNIYYFWRFVFKDSDDYNSVYLTDSRSYYVQT